MIRVSRCFTALAAGLLVSVAVSRAASPRPTLSIAAASNFVYALEALNAEFARAEPAISVHTTTSASGILFAQIKNGAPFDLFLSADTEYPRQIVADKLGEASTLKIFARGRLVLWTTSRDLDPANPVAAIRSASVRKIAIAQPKSAPYG